VRAKKNFIVRKTAAVL